MANPSSTPFDGNHFGIGIPFGTATGNNPFAGNPFGSTAPGSTPFGTPFGTATGNNPFAGNPFGSTATGSFEPFGNTPTLPAPPGSAALMSRIAELEMQVAALQRENYDLKTKLDSTMQS